MATIGLRLARDGIGYGALSTASDGILAPTGGSLTICPPSLNSYSIESILDSLQIGLQLQTIDIQPKIEYLEFILGIDSINYDLDMSSTICPPSLISYEASAVIDSINHDPQITSGEFYFIVDSIEYLIEIDSVDIRPSGIFESCQP